VTERLRAEAEAKIPSNAARGALAKAYYQRCIARSTLGQMREAVADCEKAVEIGQSSLNVVDFGRMQQGLALQYFSSGDLKKALEVSLQRMRTANASSRGWLFNTYKSISALYIQLGNLSLAETYVRNNLALIQEARGWRSYGAYRRP